MMFVSTTLNIYSRKHFHQPCALSFCEIDCGGKGLGVALVDFTSCGDQVTVASHCCAADLNIQVKLNQ